MPVPSIVFTGGGSAGHVTPNLALIDRLREEGWSIAYIGSAGGIERQLVEPEGIPYHIVSTGKLRRYFDLNNIKDPFRVLKGVADAYRILRRLKPDLLFSKGGFVSVPVVAAAKFLGIPVLSHESDMTPGLANRLATPFARRVCVSFPETAKHIGRKAEHTGLPIRETLYRGDAREGRRRCGFHSAKPVLLLMGGSLGSKRLNDALRVSLDELTKTYHIVHLCGKGHLDVSLEGRSGYRQFEYAGVELPDLLAMADLIVSRAGATSICEFLALRKPMLLVPLSLSASRGDQILNARSFEASGYARVLPDEELSPERLRAELAALAADADVIRERMAASTAANGLERILELIREQAKHA